MSIAKRMADLHKLLDVKNDNQLAISINFTSQAVRKIIKGGSSPSFEMLEALCRAYPQLNVRWLITGEGVPLHDATIEKSDLELLVTEMVILKQSVVALLGRIEALENGD